MLAMGRPQLSCTSLRGFGKYSTLILLRFETGKTLLLFIGGDQTHVHTYTRLRTPNMEIQTKLAPSPFPFSHVVALPTYPTYQHHTRPVHT